MGMGKVEARQAGLIPTLREERATGLREAYPVRLGQVQATTHAYAPRGKNQLSGDEKWARTLIDSGLDLHELDRAMKKDAPGTLNKLCSSILKSTPEPGSKAASLLKELQKLTSGKTGVINGDKFIRIERLYWQMRKLTTPN